MLSRFDIKVISNTLRHYLYQWPKFFQRGDTANRSTLSSEFTYLFTEIEWQNTASGSK
jgi:hypothetical protein